MTWPISNEGTRRSQLYLDEEWNVEDAWEESWPDASFEVLLTGMTGRRYGQGWADGRQAWPRTFLDPHLGTCPLFQSS